MRSEAESMQQGAEQTRKRTALSPADDFEELRLDQVTRAFAQTDALAELSIDIHRGEFVAFLGPSGSGKSTALNCLAGLLQLTSGTISLDDRRIDHLPPERRGFAMVFQNYALFPHMSVARNVAFGPQMQRVAKEEINQRVEHALKMVSLNAHAKKYPGQLSGGEQQRVAIGRAIASRSPIVLMDEPLSNLDAQLRTQMRLEIRRLHQELGLTTVYVTHDQQEAMSLADRMVIMKGGRVQQIGEPEDIYAAPASSFVAGFMGYSNMFQGRMTGREEGTASASVDGSALDGIASPQLDGEDVVLAVRPEDVTVAEGAAAPGRNQLEVTVNVVEYGGREYAVDSVTEGGLNVKFLADRPLEVGSRVTVEMPADRVRVYPREEA